VTRLRAVFERTRADGRAAFIPYLTAGDPHPDATVEYAVALAEGGADVLELGVPFSDPLADGPVIQRATERALAAGTTVRDVLRCARSIRDRCGIPMVLMSYANPVLQHGWDALAREAAEAGVVGTILTDVPPEEAEPFREAGERLDLATVFLVAPTSPPERIRRIAERTTGFVYCVSRLGVTGERASLSDSFLPVLDEIRKVSDLPVGVGFGISTPAHAREAGAVADGVIVGSALVAIAERAGSPERAAQALAAAARELSGALRGPRDPAGTGR
jgi:tryptophan synthase alpha chain